MILLRPEPVTFARLVAAATADGDGRRVVALVDVLAVARLRVTDDIVMVEFADHSSTAMTVREALGPHAPVLDVGAGPDAVRLVPAGEPVAGTPAFPAPVRAIHALPFDEFVGRCR